MSGKQRFSVTLSEENVAWIDENYNNRSGFLNDLVDRARSNDSQIDETIARYQLEQLNAKESSVESELESIQSQKERLRDRLQSSEMETEALLSEAREVLADVPREPTNPAIKNWADDLGWTPKELIDELEADSE